MQKLFTQFLVLFLLVACSTDDIIDQTKDLLGIEDKFNVEINGEKWSAEVRKVQKLDTPIDNFTIVGTSVKGSVLQITTGGIKKGKYNASVADAVSNLTLNFFFATYTPKVTEVSSSDDVLKITGGTVEITDVGEKDGKKYVSGKFDMKIEDEAGNYTFKNGEFTELQYTEMTSED